MNRLLGILFCIVAMSMSIPEVFAQDNSNARVITQAKVLNGDTIPFIRLPEVRVYCRKRKTKRQIARYNRLVYNVKKVLPYARTAAKVISEIEDSLSHISDEKLKKRYLKEAEDALFAEFEAPLKKLTITQGRILIKLIDRETGDTTFELIRSLKGRFSAFLWQSVARLFGSSLKSEYDPDKDDRQIEVIVLMIDDGLL
mgnify:FL=1